MHHIFRRLFGLLLALSLLPALGYAAAQEILKVLIERAKS